MLLNEHEYYQRFDFDKAANEIRSLGKERASSESFCDAINALYFKSKYQRVTTKELVSILGNPDEMIELENGDSIFEYKWKDIYTGRSHTSITRFLIRDDQIVGLR